VLLVLVFIAGAAVGIAGDRLDLIPKPVEATETAGPDTGHGGPPPNPAGAGDQTTIERFADDLGLTSGQRSEIEALLDRYRASSRELWQAVRPQYRALMDSVRSEIEEVLTPDQVEQYRALLRERYGDGANRREDGR